MRFLAKVIAIYSSQKTDFNNKNNYRDDKLTYF